MDAAVSAPLRAIVVDDEPLARDELARLDEKRERLKQIIADVAPRRSTTVETELKRLTKRRVALLAAIARAGR